jgi:hypothetical protein
MATGASLPILTGGAKQQYHLLDSALKPRRNISQRTVIAWSLKHRAPMYWSGCTYTSIKKRIEICQREA